ncbi:uncharacterized protein MYCFIDRAFT_178815 [Pseudocercospora fijiensis CIRAD86]|uniref:Uncharacterized protein n=1 Tax=Pseudocercospora fijiensis (strain CIRAD86) TaxID=383855 RepID=M3ANL8_PSEFD|nr:uncharacterized protein MYCFIDRAFT_178815 [Pseudocercospora fijiensis CIRAD86]EME78703.1 hypothetical protein MYCFIDRAFT_178815 [Pseudocercospora fijiensis CIRAD86]
MNTSARRQTSHSIPAIPATYLSSLCSPCNNGDVYGCAIVGRLTNGATALPLNDNFITYPLSRSLIPSLSAIPARPFFKSFKLGRFRSIKRQTTEKQSKAAPDSPVQHKSAPLEKILGLHVKTSAVEESASGDRMPMRFDSSRCVRRMLATERGLWKLFMHSNVAFLKTVVEEKVKSMPSPSRVSKRYNLSGRLLIRRPQPNKAKAQPAVNVWKGSVRLLERNRSRLSTCTVPRADAPDTGNKSIPAACADSSFKICDPTLRPYDECAIHLAGVERHVSDNILIVCASGADCSLSILVSLMICGLYGDVSAGQPKSLASTQQVLQCMDVLRSSICSLSIVLHALPSSRLTIVHFYASSHAHLDLWPGRICMRLLCSFPTPRNIPSNRGGAYMSPYNSKANGYPDASFKNANSPIFPSLAKPFLGHWGCFASYVPGRGRILVWCGREWRRCSSLALLLLSSCLLIHETRSAVRDAWVNDAASTAQES